VNNERKKSSSLVSEHMVSLNSNADGRIAGQDRSLDAEDSAINVPEANIVDRCESCHMGIREPSR